jgi:hypothetical protein
MGCQFGDRGMVIRNMTFGEVYRAIKAVETRT